MLVTLCGSSTRFEGQFIEAQRELTRHGINAMSLSVLPKDRVPGDDWSDDGYPKVMADLLYLDRIMTSEAILVLGDGYIGKSTAREILWSRIQNKGILAHRPGGCWDKTVDRLLCRYFHPDDAQLVAAAKRVFQ